MSETNAVEPERGEDPVNSRAASNAHHAPLLSGDEIIDNEASRLAQAPHRMTTWLQACLRRLAALWARPRVRWGTGVCVVLIAGVATFVMYERSRFQPPPDYAVAPIDSIFEYTLLTDDFNRLPVKERLALIQQLIERLRGLGGNDSVMLAMFASLIAGEAREQLEENVSRLAVDLFDDYAQTYDRTASADEREAFIQDKVVEFQKTMEALAGDVSDRTDEERLASAERQANRDMGQVRDGKVAPDEMLRVFDVVNNGLGKHATGHQKTRISSFMRDMVYTLRRGDGPPTGP